MSLDLALGSRLKFEIAYPGDLTQPIDTKAIGYSVSFKIPLGSAEDAPQRVEPPDPTTRLP